MQIKKHFILTLILLIASIACCFAQCGSGPAKRISINDIAGGPYATEKFVIDSTGGNLVYYGTNTASDIGGFSALTQTDFSPEVSATVSGITTTEQVAGQQLTPDGEPGLTSLRIGIISVFICAESSSKDIYVKPTLWKRASSGVVTQLATASGYITVTSTKTIHTTNISIPSVISLDTTDRLFMRNYAYSSLGTNDLTVYFGGDSGTHFHFPVDSGVFARSDLSNVSDVDSLTVASQLNSSGTLNVDSGGKLLTKYFGTVTLSPGTSTNIEDVFGITISGTYYGRLSVSSPSSVGFAEFAIDAGGTTSIISSYGSDWATADTASKQCLFWNSNEVYLKNNYAATTVTFMLELTR